MLCPMSVSHRKTFDPSRLTVRELLAAYVSILDELLSRRLIRTRNSPLGDLVESLALRAYGGELAPNSQKSYDVLAADGRRVQVKARLIDPADKRSQNFSAFRSWDFDIALFVVFDTGTYDLLWAREVTQDEAREIGRWVGHTASSRLLVRQVASIGTDVTARLAEAYDRIDEPETLLPRVTS